MINYVLKITFNESVLNDGPHISAKKPKSLDFNVKIGCIWRVIIEGYICNRHKNNTGWIHWLTLTNLKKQEIYRIGLNNLYFNVSLNGILNLQTT